MYVDPVPSVSTAVCAGSSLPSATGVSVIVAVVTPSVVLTADEPINVPPS